MTTMSGLSGLSATAAVGTGTGGNSEGDSGVTSPRSGVDLFGKVDGKSSPDSIRDGDEQSIGVMQKEGEGGKDKEKEGMKERELPLHTQSMQRMKFNPLNLPPPPSQSDVILLFIILFI